MKISLQYLSLCFFLMVPFILSAQSNLKEVDYHISQKVIYENEKLQRIANLKAQFDNSSNRNSLEAEYGICAKLYREYEIYQYDSAYNYAQKMIEIASLLEDDYKINESKLLMAYCCLSAGLFMESKEIANSIDTTAFTLNHYSFYTKFYLDMAHSIGVEPYLDNYLQLSIGYNEKIINILGAGNPYSSPYIVNIYRCREQYPEAIAAIKQQLSDSKMEERSRTLNLGGLGYFYLMDGDTAKAIPYLCQAAINDIQSVNKETPALRMLAGILYKQGDIERAYTYAKLALDDANFFNARHRKIEVGDVLPIIDEIRFNIINRQKNQLLKYSILSSILLVLLVAAIIIIMQQMRKLRVARKFIERQNEDLHQINSQLKETSRIKDAYIGNFFSVNSSFIDKIEALYKLVIRKITSRQIDDLLLMLKKTDIKKERESLYVSFDNTFLKLFPDFVDQYNLLFNENDRIAWSDGEALTAEMRIFALIRLGVASSERIAKFLDYSVNTIHTYKTKAKNRSALNNEIFEIEIMKIESGNTLKKYMN